MKREGSTINKLKIESLLKEHKGQQSKYINYKLLKKSISKEERASV
jgi:type VI protein secretion system component Hcp